MAVTDAAHVVAIVVDPEFGDRVGELLKRLPVWIAATDVNRAAAKRAWAAASSPSGSHTAIGALTTFTVDITTAPELWCIQILGTVAGHHDRYSQSPGYSAEEIYGVPPTQQLLKALADYRLTQITPLSDGFRASTSDGQPAASPNDD